MSLMERLRTGSDSFLMQALLAVVVITFVFWGADARVGDGNGSIVAKVNGRSITDTTFNQMLRGAARQRGGNLSDAEYQALGFEVLDSVIEREVLLQEAHRLGLEVSEDEVRAAIYKLEYFKDENGKFNKGMYERMLKANGSSDADFQQQMYEDLLLGKLRELAGRAAQVTPAEVKDAWTQQNTKITITWAKVPSAAFLAEVPVTDAEAAEFAAANAPRIKAAYDEQFQGRFNQPRKAGLYMILLRADLQGATEDEVKARAEQVRAELAAGADFETIARRWSEDLSAVNGGKMGVMAEDQLDPAVAEAVFKAGPGKLTEVVKSTRGFQILRVDTVEEAKVVSLEEATPILAKEIIAADKAPALAKEFSEKLLAEWKAASAVPTELLVSKGIVPEISADLALDARSIPQLGAAPQITAMMATAAVGTVLNEVFDVGGDRVVVQVTQRTDPDPARWETDKLMVRQQLLMMERMSFVEAWTRDLVARAKVERLWGMKPAE